MFRWGFVPLLKGNGVRLLPVQLVCQIIANLWYLLYWDCLPHLILSICRTIHRENFSRKWGEVKRKVSYLQRKRNVFLRNLLPFILPLLSRSPSPFLLHFPVFLFPFRISSNPSHCRRPLRCFVVYQLSGDHERLQDLHLHQSFSFSEGMQVVIKIWRMEKLNNDDDYGDESGEEKVHQDISSISRDTNPALPCSIPAVMQYLSVVEWGKDGDGSPIGSSRAGMAFHPVHITPAMTKSPNNTFSTSCNGGDGGVNSGGFASPGWICQCCHRGAQEMFRCHKGSRKLHLHYFPLLLILSLFLFLTRVRLYQPICLNFSTWQRSLPEMSSVFLLVSLVRGLPPTLLAIDLLPLLLLIHSEWEIAAGTFLEKRTKKEK